MIYVVSLVLGLLLTCWNVYQRRGRTAAARGWAYKSWNGKGPRNVLVLWPLLIGFLLIFALMGVLPPGGDDVAVVFAVLCCLLVCLYILLPLRIPEWTKPRWYREGRFKPKEPHRAQSHRS